VEPLKGARGVAEQGLKEREDSSQRVVTAHRQGDPRLGH